MKTCNVIPAKAGIQSFAAPWMPSHAREGGDCAGMTILAAVMINSRLDSSARSLRDSIHTAMTLVHLDTDIGGDIDDLCALAMLLRWPGVTLAGVTTNLDLGGKRAGYARYVLATAGRADVPVAAGADVDAHLDRYRVRAGLPDEVAYWPEPIPPRPTPLDDALDLLEASIHQGALILAIGAFTNLALLEERSPGILRQARLAMMGGYVFPVRAGYPPWGNDMDWNMQIDVAASKLVLERADPLLVPLTVTVETALRRAHLPALRAAGPMGELLAWQAEAHAAEYDNERLLGQVYPNLPDDLINFQHDPLTCAIALGWNEGVRIETLPLTFAIEDGWLHERVDTKGKPVRIVTAVDGPRFSKFWVEMVTLRYGPDSPGDALDAMP